MLRILGIRGAVAPVLEMHSKCLNIKIEASNKIKVIPFTKPCYNRKQTRPIGLSRLRQRSKVHFVQAARATQTV